MAQVSRLITEYKRTGRLKKTEYRRHRFPKKYTPSEVELLAKTKGVYHTNGVDEITQWEIVTSVERISEVYLVPVLEGMLVQSICRKDGESSFQSLSINLKIC